MPKTKTKHPVKLVADQDFLVEAPELSIFLACVTAVKDLQHLAEAFECGELTRVAFSRQSTGVVAELSELVSATERFDIVCPVMEFGRFSTFFWRWFNWWNDFTFELTPRQVGYLEKAAWGGAATRSHRPKGHWLHYRKSPAFTLVIN